MSGDKSERRGHFRGKPRPGRRVQVRYQAPGDGEVQAHTKNIGVGGAFIVTPQPPKIGTVLRILVEMPAGGEPIEVRAEVRWAVTTPITTPGGEHEVGVGVRFAGLDVDQLLALNEYFASLSGTVDYDA